MKKIFNTVILICSVLAGQATAAEPVLPTVVFSDSTTAEYAYDSLGHIISEKYFQGTDLKSSITRSYQQLPNGEFVLTSEINARDTVQSGMTATYDSKGMQLSYKIVKSGKIQEDSWEAVVDTAGIRTGLKLWNGSDWEFSPDYTFDSKGRVTKFIQRDTITYVQEEGMARANGDDFTETVFTYTWGEGEKELLTMTVTGMDGSDSEVVISNIELVHNQEYFDPYSLDVYDDLFSSSTDDNIADNTTLFFSWDLDNYAVTHKVYYNADLSSTDGSAGTVSCTITGNVWTETMELMGEEQFSRTSTFTQLPNGGWKLVTNDDEDGTSIERREYDEYGLLTKIYNYDGEEASETEYKRSYDGDRLTGTSVYDDGQLSTTWTDDTDTAVEESGIDGRTPVAYYSIMGTKLQDAPEKGLYIVVYNNGTIEKVMKQ